MGGTLLFLPFFICDLIDNHFHIPAIRLHDLDLLTHGELLYRERDPDVYAGKEKIIERDILV